MALRGRGRHAKNSKRAQTLAGRAEPLARRYKEKKTEA
jgi:hypothetical protein